MIRRCDNADFEAIHTIINDGATAYRGVIPADCLMQPYMSEDHLRRSIEKGVVFWGYEEDGRLIGVMGIQEAGDVTLIRHAYVLTEERRRGVGTALMGKLYAMTTRPTLVGTWAAAVWAHRFYEGHGFRLVDPETKDRLLTTYWSIPARQVETSVVLADARWWRAAGKGAVLRS